MKFLPQRVARLVVSIFAVGLMAFVAQGAYAGNPIHTNCSGTQCVIDAVWMVFQTPDINNPTTQTSFTSMTTNTSLVQSGITNQGNQKSSFSPGDTLTVPINASGELISTGAQFYDSPPVYFDAGGQVRAIMENIVSCSQVVQTVVNNLSGYQGNSNNCRNVASVNDPLKGTWTDSWATSAGVKLTCTTNADGKSATCASASDIPLGSATITLTRTIKDLKWDAFDAAYKIRGLPTMNLHKFYSDYNYTYLFKGWDTLHDAPMKTSATVNFVKKVPATVDLKVSSSAMGTFTDGPITIPKNTKAYLKWSSTSATSCSMTGGITGTGFPTSSLNYPTGNLTTDTTFTITCTGPGGVSVPDSVTVNVGAAVTPTPNPSSSPTPSPSSSPTPSPTSSVSPTPTATPCTGTCPSATPSPTPCIGQCVVAPTPTPTPDFGGFHETR